MANEVQIDPRYLSYDKAEVEDLLGKVEHADAEPTAESENMISSGAVASALGNYSTTEQMNAALASKMDATDIATEESVRSIVSNYNPDAEPEPEPESESESESE